MSTASRLTKAQLRELERELVTERARLERTMMARSGAEDSAPFGVAPRPSANSGGALGVAVDDRALARQEALTDALRRIEAGTYGVCSSCRNPIPYGRLIAIPEATHCVACGFRA